MIFVSFIRSPYYGKALLPFRIHSSLFLLKLAFTVLMHCACHPETGFIGGSHENTSGIFILPALVEGQYVIS